MRADTRLSNQGPNPDQADGAAEVLRMVADPTRVLSLWAVLDKESSVKELADTR
jgi:hypothetical protein